MSNLTLLIIVSIIFVVALIILFSLKSPKRRKDSIIEYTAALNYLITGDRRKAFQKLKEAVRNNTTNIDAYIKLGDILRDEGHVERAIKIHRGLTVRSGLTTLEQIDILKSLIKDYRTCKKYDKALEVCQSLLDLTADEIWVQEILLSLYQEKDEWDKAFDVQKQIFRHKGETNQKILAFYKVQAGQIFVQNEKERDARIKYREAMKIDKSCAPAYLYLSDSYIREHRLSDALSVLRRFIERIPDLAYLAFDRFKEILYEKGNFGEIESIFKELLLHNSDNTQIRFALADIYDRKGELKKAIKLCEEVLERNPDSLMAKRYLVKYYAKTKMEKKALDLALELNDDSINVASKFTCHSCGNIAQKPYWHCPVCKEWDSYIK